MKFTPYCSGVDNIGTLEISANNKKLFSSVPSCDRPYSQSVPKSLLNEGENNVIFKTSRGSYSVEQISVAFDFNKPKTKTYYFDVSKDAFDRITNGDVDVMLSIKFVDANAQKNIKVDVNGKLDQIDTNKAIFSKSISSKIQEGNNYINLQPLSDVEVAELKIELQ